MQLTMSNYELTINSWWLSGVEAISKEASRLRSMTEEILQTPEGA